MSSMVWFVLHDAALLSDVLSVWKESGVQGITILPSTGLRRLEESNALRDDIPLIPSMEDLLGEEEILNRTLFSIVENDEMVEKVIRATEAVVGDLDQPNTGILCVFPITRVYGLNRKPEDLATE